MKRIFCGLMVVTLLGANGTVRAQDAATEERLNKLNGHIEVLLAAKAEQDKRLAALAREIENLRDQLARPSGNYASADDLRKVADAVKDVDQRRVEDNEKIVKSIESIGRAAAASSRAESRPRPAPAVTSTASTGADKGFEYVIAPGDTLSTLVEAYRLKGIKVSVDDILKANAGLKERSLKVGQKIFIPAP